MWKLLWSLITYFFRLLAPRPRRYERLLDDAETRPPDGKLQGQGRGTARRHGVWVSGARAWVIGSLLLQGFYMCHSGSRSSAFACPGGTLFSEELGVCDWRGKVTRQDWSVLSCCVTGPVSAAGTMKIKLILATPVLYSLSYAIFNLFISNDALHSVQIDCSVKYNKHCVSHLVVLTYLVFNLPICSKRNCYP